jgi:hypothetical protein
MTGRVVKTHGTITLLNATYEMISQKVTMQKAVRLLSLGKATVEEDDGSGRMLGPWPFPKVLRLVKFVQIAFDVLNGSPQISKQGVLRRDNYECAYCGKEANTVDHINPKDYGGKTSWMNLVACCFRCNQNKRNRTPSEAGMKLRKTPYAPKRKLR